MADHAPPVIRFNLKAARLARRLTQAQLAERVGVRQATVSDLETGKARMLRLALLDALCRVLDATPAEMLDGAPTAGRAL